MKLFTIVFCFLFCSCGRQERSTEVNHQGDEYNSLTYERSRAFPAVYREAKALLSLQDYLQSKGINTDSLYIYNIIYSDSLCTVSDDLYTPDSLHACFAIFNIKHKINVDYFKKIEQENIKSIKGRTGEDEWKPLDISSKPSFLKKDIIAYYYFGQDSIAITYYDLQ